MKKYRAGNFSFCEEADYYTDDFIEFYKENGEELSDGDLKDWAIWLNSPWSQAHESYKISCNCKDAYTQIGDDEPAWRCEYSILGYEGLSASVLGYGFTELEALKECMKHFKELQEKYNVENESV